MPKINQVNKKPTLIAENNNVKASEFIKKDFQNNKRLKATDRIIFNTDPIEPNYRYKKYQKKQKIERPRSFIWMQAIAIGFSALWVMGAATYINRTVGWNNISSFLPHELGGFLAGVFAPVALIWMVVAFVLRSTDVKLYADALRHELQAMIFPSEQAERHINNDIERLIQQSAEMSRATGMAAQTLEVAKQTLQDQMNRFQETTQNASGDVHDLNQSLEKRIQVLNNLSTELVSQTSQMDDKTRVSENLWQNALEKAKDMSQLLDKGTTTLDQKTSDFNNVIERLSQLNLNTVESIDQAKTMIEEQRNGLMDDADRAAEYVAQVADAMRHGTDQLYQLTDDSLDKAKLVETRIQGQIASLERILQNLTEKSSQMDMATTSNIQKLNDATEKTVASADDVQEMIEKAVLSIDNATQHAKETAHNTIDIMGHKVQETALVFNDIQKQIRLMADLFDARREALDLSRHATGEQAQKIQDILDQSFVKIDQGSAQLIAQVEKFREKIETPIHNLESVTHKIDLSSSSFATILQEKIQELDKASGDVEHRAGKIETQLDKRTKDIALLAGKIASDSKKIEQDLDKHEQKLSTTVMDTVQSVRDVGDHLIEQAQTLNTVSDQSVDQISKLDQAIKVSRKHLVDEAQMAEDAMAQMTHKFDTGARQINKQSLSALNEVKSLNTAMADRADRFDQVSSKVIDRIQKAQIAFNALQTGYKNVADDSVEKLAQASGSFVETLSTLRHGSQDASQIVDQIIDKTKQSQVEIKGLTQSLQQQSIHFDQLAQAQNTLAQSVDTMDAQTGKILNRFDQATQTLQTSVSDMDKAANQTVNTARDVSRSLIQQSEAMSAKAQLAVADLDNAGARLTGKAQLIKETIQQTVTHADGLTNNLDTHINDLSQLTQSSTERIEKALNKLINHTQKMDHSSGSLLDKLNTLSVVGEKVTSDVDHTVDRLQQQAELLMNASTQAYDSIDQLRAEDNKVKRDGFFTSTKFVVESLNSLTLDFARMLHGQLPDKTWKAYQNGDMNAFTRYILSFKDESSHEKIRSKFKEDHEFRTYVQRYLRQFEEVYDQAHDNDHAQLLSSVFMTSDVGKMYLYLCAILKREPRRSNTNKNV